jgi:hypothetical protein
MTGDAARGQNHTAEYVAGQRDSDYLPQVKGHSPGLQRAIYDKINAECGAAPGHVGSRERGRRVGKLPGPASAGVD